MLQRFCEKPIFFFACTLFHKSASSKVPSVEPNSNKKNVCWPELGTSSPNIVKVNMWITIWYLGDLFKSYQCIILYRFCKVIACISLLFSLDLARGEFHAIAVYTRQLQIHPCRKMANNKFTAKTIIIFLNISYSNNYHYTHMYVDNWSIKSVATAVSLSWYRPLEVFFFI